MLIKKFVGIIGAIDGEKIMALENLLKMTEDQLRIEYAEAIRKGNKKRTIEINTIRIKRIIMTGIGVFPLEERKEGIFYFCSDNIAYFQPKKNTATDTLNGFVNFLILAHISSRNPVIVDMDLLKSLIPRDVIEFNRVDKVLDEEEKRTIILNHDRMTEDIAQIHLPDVWIPNGEEELVVAVTDMPKNDSDSVLLNGVSSSLTIGNYKTVNKVFTDVFYSPNRHGETPKAIILNRVAGISLKQLEEELQRQGVQYERAFNEVHFDSSKDSKTSVELDLSTIWTAKYIEIVEDAIKDSVEREGFVPDVVKIHDVSSTITTTIDYDGERIGLDVYYDTVVIFDGKLILYSAFDNSKSDIVELFMEKGFSVEVSSEPVDLSQFEVSKKTANQIEKHI